MTKTEFFNHAKHETVKGIFWSLGATIGFALVSTIFVVLLSSINTVPIIGNFVAQVVEQTERNLENR